MNRTVKIEASNGDVTVNLNAKMRICGEQFTEEEEKIRKFEEITDGLVDALRNSFYYSDIEIKK
ncbi:MAG: hypothetical protein HQ594_06190 [Candidatus Omnitrophica bacterium]|nr:hypothetical protein [Candidatus Omnitrophota bacterium]